MAAWSSTVRSTQPFCFAAVIYFFFFCFSLPSPGGHLADCHQTLPCIQQCCKDK